MQIQISSLDTLLSKRNLKYSWESKFSKKKGLHVGEYNVYIILDSWTANKTSLKTPFGTLEVEYDIKYIGKGVWDNMFTKLRRKRCLNHVNDLYSDNLKQYKDRYLIFFPSTTLDEHSAYNLESALIHSSLASGYKLTKVNVRGISTYKNQLWNKYRGHGNHTRTATKRKVYKN